MHHHDLDLIMALAEGGLTGSDLASAEATVAACAECEEDLAYQRVAIDLLRRAPAATMTPQERSRLRSGLMEQLHMEVSPTPARATVPRRRWLTATRGLAAAAAVLVAVIAVGPGMQLLGSGTDDSAGEIVASGSDLTSTSVAPFAPPGSIFDSQTSQAEGGSLQSDELGEDQRQDLIRFAESSARLGVPTFPEGALPDITYLRSVVIAAGGDPAAARRQIAETAAVGIELIGGDSDEILARCLDEGLAGLDATAVVASFPVAVEQTPTGDALVMAYMTQSLDETVLVLHAPGTCSFLETAGPG